MNAIVLTGAISGLTLLLTATQAFGQVTHTVFSENFDSPNSATWVSGSGSDAEIIAGKPWRIVNNGVFVARLNNGQLHINSRDGNSTHGQGFGYVPCGGTGSVFDNTYYNPTLSSSSGVITWTFNMQRPTSVSNSSGFSCSQSSSQNNITTGLAFILASNGTSSILSSTDNCNPNGTAVGYAVIFGGGTSANITPRLVQFTNGLHNGTHTTIATWSGTVPKANYMSVRVTYDPSNNAWTLQVRNDGTSAFANPDAGTYSAAVTGTNGTYTNQALNYMGGYFQSGCTGNCDEASSGYVTRFDNVTVKVTETCTSPTQPSAIAGNATLCSGASGTYSVTNDPNATSYTWTLPGSWTGSSTTNSINATAGATGGTITVTATNACGTSTAQTLTVTSGAVPAQPGAITGSPSLCDGASDTYTVPNDASATGYTWTLPSGWSGSSTTNSINATAGATGGTITVTATNACGTSTAQTLTVTSGAAPAQPGAITGSPSLCDGASDTYTVPNDASATGYTWTLPSGWSGSSTTNSINATAGATGGTITVTANNTCGASISQTFTVTSGAVPAQPGAITGSPSLCDGASDTYTVPNDASATGYTWTLPSGWSGSSTTNSINATAGVTGGTITVTANNTCGASTSQTFTVTSGAVPAQPGTITGSPSLCDGASDTYTVPNDASATGYTWTLPSGWSGSSTTNSINATAGATGGTITVTANNTCGSSTTQTLSVSSGTIPTQPSAIGGAIALCAGNTETYTITSDPNATSYTWTLPSGWSGSSTTNSINATAGATGGTITVTATNACGSSTAQNVSVTVNDVPGQPSTISGTTTFCVGDTETYTVASDPNATSYTWTLPGDWTGSSTTNSITATTGASGGTITVTANNTCGNSVAQTLAVAVGSAPAQPSAISGNATLCAGDTETYTVTNDPNATSYTWTLPGGWSGSSTTNSISATTDASGGTISVTATNACGSSTAQNLSITVNSIPAQPSSITGNAAVCDGTTETYSITSDPNATDYTWTLPPSWSGNSTTNSINTTVGASGGILTVTANNSCGSSVSQSINLSVGSAPAQPTAIAGGATLCAGDTETYTVTNDLNATDYTWTLPGGWIGSSTTNSISTTADASGGTISVTANNACGSSLSQTLAITVGTIPVQPSAINGNTSLCDGASGTFSVTADPNATSYTWTLPGSWTGSSTTNSINATAGATGGTITVTANNSCGSSVSQTLTVTPGSIPAQPSAISGNPTFCPGDNSTYSISPDPNATSYTWTLPSGWNGSSTTNSISTLAGANGGTISVTANNVCGSSTATTFNVSFGNTPAQPSAINGSIGICYATGDTYSVTLDPSATGYTWTLPSGWSGSSNSNSINATAGTTGGTITVTANNACGSSAPQTLAVTVNTASSATLTQTACNSYTLNGQTYNASGTYTQQLTNAAGCDSTLTLNLTITPINLNILVQNGNILTAQESGAAYQWVDCDNGNAPIPGATAQAYLATSNGNYAVIISKNGCTVQSNCYNVTSINVEEIALSDLLNIYPNPSNGVYTLDFSQLMSEVQLTVYSINGQLLRSENLHSGKSLLLNISEQAPGVYILKLEFKGQAYFTRLIKQ